MKHIYFLKKQKKHDLKLTLITQIISNNFIKMNKKKLKN